MPQLQARVRERSALSAADVSAMHGLFGRYYEGGSRAVFEHDLAGKTHVIELNDDDGQLRGFSTLAVFDIAQDGRPDGQHSRGIFSGDTVIHHENWGEQALARCFCRFAGSVKAQAPTGALYWLLIAKGYRTYRYLPLFARRYYPAAGVTTPPAIAGLLTALCRQRFGEAYDAQRGLVRLDPASGTRLRPDWCGVRDDLAQLAEVAFFLAANPDFAQGDELACICALEESNLRSFALRAFREGLTP
jgi:hypothetical protein